MQKFNQLTSKATVEGYTRRVQLAMDQQSKQNFSPVPLVRTNTSETLLNRSAESHLSKKVIGVTKCLSPECTGVYTDTISESILIICKDPKHVLQENAGQATKPEPAAEDASSNSIEVDLHGKEALT